MKQQRIAWKLVPALLVLASLVCTPGARAQDNGQTATLAPHSDPQNIQAYIDLLRLDVRQQKAQMMGAVMQLNAEDAAKFWPLYEEYDAELAKVNDLRWPTFESMRIPMIR
jgi:hypothetical protein